MNDEHTFTQEKEKKDGYISQREIFVGLTRMLQKSCASIKK